MWGDFNFFRLTDRRLTDKTDCLTPLRACARGVIINTTIRVPTAPRMAAMRVEGLVGFPIMKKFVRSATVLEEGEGEELLGSPVSPAEVACGNHHSQLLTRC